MADAFYGEIRAFGFNYLPQGWLFCDGSSVPVQQYQILYAVIGNSYGGDRTNFNLPDLRGRVPIDAGSAGGLAFTVGQAVGAPSVTLGPSQMASHTHAAQGVQAIGGQTLAAAPSATAYPSIPRNGTTVYDAWTPSLPTTTLSSTTIGSTGGGGAHGNISPYLALNFCICADGAVFPVRP